jgi:chloramphenicol 3-O-phosphotransferase
VGPIAANLFDAGFTVLVDEPLVTRDRLARTLAWLDARPVLLVVLAPRPTVAYRRMGLERAARWGYLDEVLRRELADVGLWVDSSEIPPESVAGAIVERAWGEPAAKVGGFW